MKNLSLKMDDTIFNETEEITAKINKTETGTLMELWNFIIFFRREG